MQWCMDLYRLLEVVGMTLGLALRSARTRGAAWWCGWGFTAVGVVHMAYGVVTYWSDAADLARAGFAGAVGVERERFFWFMLGGPSMLLAGAWARQEFRRTGRVPRAVAWYAAFLASLVALMPDGGFWLFIPLAALAFHASRPPSTEEA